MAVDENTKQSVSGQDSLLSTMLSPADAAVAIQNIQRSPVAVKNMILNAAADILSSQPCTMSSESTINALISLNQSPLLNENQSSNSMSPSSSMMMAQATTTVGASVTSDSVATALMSMQQQQQQQDTTNVVLAELNQQRALEQQMTAMYNNPPIGSSVTGASSMSTMQQSVSGMVDTQMAMSMDGGGGSTNGGSGASVGMQSQQYQQHVFINDFQKMNQICGGGGGANMQ